MILDTTNAGWIYVQDRPDWGADYDFQKEFVTVITKSKNASEQRARIRQKPRYKLAYFIAAMTTAEASVRRAQALKGMGSNLAVPIWHAWEDVSSIVGNVINVAHTSLLLRPFKAGALVYFEQTGFTSVFRRVASVAAGAVTCVAGNAEYPVIAVPAYTTPRMYPVISGISDENSVRFLHPDVNKTTQLFDVIEL